MQIHGPSDEVHGDLRVTLNTSASPFAVVYLGSVQLFLQSSEDCDRLIVAASTAKEMLLGEPAHDHDDADLPWVSAHQFIPCTTCTAGACNACSRPAGDAVHRIAGDFGPQQVTE